MKNDRVKGNEVVAFCGDDFESVAQIAQGYSLIDNVDKWFNFNGITCVVNTNTYLEYLWRDYLNASLMGWKVVGPICVEKYGEETQRELDKRTKEREEKHKNFVEENVKKQEEAKSKLLEKIGDRKILLSNSPLWYECIKNNSDEYGSGIIRFAKFWAILMQGEILKGKSIEECAEQACSEADIEGITGFMYGYAVNILSECWYYGEELRRWHNKKYNHKGSGVVNPAILTLKY